MNYPKIHSLYKRDPKTHRFTTELSRVAFGSIDYWHVEEKIDGTNIRLVWYKDGRKAVLGRTDNAQLHPGLFARLQEIQETLSPRVAEVFPEGGVTFYGEGIGPKIQGGYGGPYDFVLFDIWASRWGERNEVDEWADLVTTAPDLGTMPTRAAEEMVSTGFQSRLGDFPAEGVILRPFRELAGRDGRIITKLKTKDYR